jgi:hypothetical protein
MLPRREGHRYERLGGSERLVWRYCELPYIWGLMDLGRYVQPLDIWLDLDRLVSYILYLSKVSFLGHKMVPNRWPMTSGHPMAEMCVLHSGGSQISRDFGQFRAISGNFGQFW